MSHALEFAPPEVKAATVRGVEPENYLTHETTLASWLFSTDHKRIAILYAVSITVFFFIGGAAAALIRINLLSPEGAIVAPEVYNRLFTWHGVVMVWFFLVPSIPVTLGNFVIPLMLGARDLAFPKINLMSWYLFIIGGTLTVVSLFWGGVDTGWTFYTPLSSAYAKGHVVIAAFGIILAGFSSIATGLNFIISIHKLRAPGMTFHRMPIFLWSLYATSVINVLATPVLAMTLLLLAFETFFHVGVFDPALGGDPLLFQHMFWFYSHPAVYIMILPGMGVVSEIIPAFSRKRLFGYEFVAWCSVAIAVIGFFVWTHHMFVAGVSVFSAIVFSLTSFAVAVPSAIKVFNWIGTMHKGFIHFDAPMIYALGFIALFTIGGLTGLWLATLAADVHLHDTYFVVAHFHFIMVGGMVSAYFAGLHYWWPKITGRMYPEMWGRVAALIIFFGFILTFAPQFMLGWYGMPRRYATYAPEFQILNVFSSAGAGVLAVGYVLPLGYLVWSLLRGARAPDNPWGATGLEWQTRSPPPVENFTTTPVVTRPPYDYPVPGAIEARAK
jgi:cytochrome c oxidase subunit 1